mmetsp:Transcript_22977/g.64248  ORF Transcript_22977/g.64248 Transcript_22977/m.64248 type:complete len:245 (-) Transcript_22977:494-1228(-)
MDFSRSSCAHEDLNISRSRRRLSRRGVISPICSPYAATRPMCSLFSSKSSFFWATRASRSCSSSPWSRLSFSTSACAASSFCLRSEISSAPEESFDSTSTSFACVSSPAARALSTSFCSSSLRSASTSAMRSSKARALNVEASRCSANWRCNCCTSVASCSTSGLVRAGSSCTGASAAASAHGRGVCCGASGMPPNRNFKPLARRCWATPRAARKNSKALALAGVAASAAVAKGAGAASCAGCE